jgi:hypothetical protein
MNIVQVKMMSPITAAFGFTGRSYCILEEEIEEGETIEGVLRRVGKSNKEFGQAAFWPDPDTGEIAGIDVALNDEQIPPWERLEEAKLRGGDVVTVSLASGC